MKYLILGGGPAGLSFANRLHEIGEESFLILEHEAEAGGLCRSMQVDGSPFDIGGGHFLDTRNSKVNEFLFQFMPEEEWNLFERDSRISVAGSLINHPIEANIWQLSVDEQVEYLKSIAVAGCNSGKIMPQKFIEWIYWKLGNKIAEDYMVPYNKKMFGSDLNMLGTYWLDKLPNVNFEETLRSCLEKRAHGSQPGHAKFYYPKKYGYGELWLRMADLVNNHIVYNETVRSIDFGLRKVTTKEGGKYQADVIVTTIPWEEFEECIGMPSDLFASINKLKKSSIQTEYFSDTLDTNAQWIYYPDLKFPYHRILVRHNFCPHSRGYWAETNKEYVYEGDTDNFTYMNNYAYPLNTISKPEIMRNLLLFCKNNDVYGLGRWGEHQHYNSDVTVAKAIELCDFLRSKVNG